MAQNNENLKKLADMMEMLDTKKQIDEFVSAFAGATKLLKDSNSTLSKNYTEAVMGMQVSASQLEKALTEKNAKAISDVKSQIGTALGELTVQIGQLAAGKDGRDGIDGVSVIGPAGKDGLDGSPDTPDQVVSKVNEAGIMIKASKVEGLLDIERMAKANSAYGAGGITTPIVFKGGTQVGRAKNINFIPGTGVTMTVTVTGDQANITINSTASGGGTSVREEDASGLTLAHTPIANTLQLFRGGTRITVTSGDYTIAGAVITLASPLGSGETLTADYTY